MSDAMFIGPSTHARSDSNMCKRGGMLPTLTKVTFAIVPNTNKERTPGGHCVPEGLRATRGGDCAIIE